MAAKKRNASGQGGDKTKKAPAAGPAETASAGNGSPPVGAVAVAPAAVAPPTTTITRAIQQVRPMARDAFQEGRGRSQQMVQDFEGAIRQQPIRSLLMAAGVGFLIGLIWR